MKSIILLSAAIAFISGCTNTGPGERGVRVTLGSPGDQPYGPGPHFWLPLITRVHNVDVQIQNSEIQSTAATKDVQDVTTEVAVNWELSADDVVKTFKTIGDEQDVLNRIIRPAVNEVLKAATAKRTAEEVLTERMELKKDIDQGLKVRLAQYGVTLYDVNIVDLKFSEEFTKAVEAKQVAEQGAKQAAYEKDKATQEGLAAIERAKGQAEAQKLLKASITSEILEQQAIQKWNGVFPTYMGGGALPFINVNLKAKGQ